MRVINGLLIVVMTLAVSGWSCTRQEVPKERLVEIEKTVPVDKEYTKRCPIAEPTNDSGEELLRVARARKASLQECNKQLEAIENLK